MKIFYCQGKLSKNRFPMKVKLIDQKGFHVKSSCGPCTRRMYNSISIKRAGILWMKRLEWMTLVNDAKNIILWQLGSNFTLKNYILFIIYIAFDHINSHYLVSQEPLNQNKLWNWFYLNIKNYSFLLNLQRICLFFP